MPETQLNDNQGNGQISENKESKTARNISLRLASIFAVAGAAVWPFTGIMVENPQTMEMVKVSEISYLCYGFAAAAIGCIGYALYSDDLLKRSGADNDHPPSP